MVRKLWGGRHPTDVTQRISQEMLLSWENEGSAFLRQNFTGNKRHQSGQTILVIKAKMQSGRTTGKVLLTAGFYSSQQNSPRSWVWASVKRWVQMDWASERRPTQMDWVSEKILAECLIQGLTE